MKLDLGPDPRTDILRRLHASMIAAIGRIIYAPECSLHPEKMLVHGIDHVVYDNTSNSPRMIERE